MVEQAGGEHGEDKAQDLFPLDVLGGQAADPDGDPLPQSGKGQQKAGKSQIDHRGEDRITAVPRDQESDRDIGADSGREQEPGLVQRDEAEQLVEEDVAPLVIQEPYALQNIRKRELRDRLK